ncbi:hypothetical protein EHQ53_17660 [Leptospira langatensis]|uniref:Yip1 domain-containing protein n=1 Tax=Leptospira langatensis TaxID=2484983 RepID=A0A5F1ZP47_9LEPT|nr:hypothetical protein [Leptospira langatensis]TGK05459.1 hypothetical protein EHO57_01900 [Leptospira langatensis]TGL38595.1 hypothetical protein EHQ53_17660 [Leptospira langatensis]
MSERLEKLKALLKDNIYTRAFWKNLNYNLHPEEVLKETPKEFLRGTIKIFLLFLGTYVVFNVLVSLTNAAYLVEYGDQMKAFYDQGRISLSMYLMNSFPNSIILLAVSFLVFQYYVAGLSYVSLWILGEKDRSFRRALGIAFSTGLYVLLSFFPILVIFNVVPNSFQKDPFKMILFLSFNGIFFFGSIVVQSIFYVKMYRAVFGQNLGRALLTWLFPFFAFVTFIVSNL